MQTITISGYLGEDAQLRRSDSGTEFVTFTLASKDSRGESHFFPCTWFQTRSKMLQHLVKGAAVIVTGELQIWDARLDSVDEGIPCDSGVYVFRQPPLRVADFITEEDSTSAVEADDS